MERDQETLAYLRGELREAEATLEAVPHDLGMSHQVAVLTVETIRLDILKYEAKLRLRKRLLTSGWSGIA